MRFSYSESMCDPSFYLPLARAAETAGFTTYLVPDSICYPDVSDSKYPYTPTGEREFLEDKPFLEPFPLIAAMGAVTTTLEFATFVLKLPIRSPVLVAKSAMSVAVLTNERFSLGVGISPWPEDFQVCFQDWPTRGKRTDEMIAILRLLMTGEFHEFHGTHYDLPRIKLSPAPKRPIRILVGGHSEPALKRAALLGDGWMHAGGKHEELVHGIERLAVLRRECGREAEPFQIHASSRQAYTTDGVQKLEELGITDVVVGFRNPYTKEHDTQSLQVKLDAMKWYADNVIAKLSAG